jgi:23S rRNA U2552 (ribose-2'-O)-methylase RlmE/FtsJ
MEKGDTIVLDLGCGPGTWLMVIAQCEKRKQRHTIFT